MADPSWLQDAADQLDRLQNPHRELKRTTIIALVDARLAGRSEETVWDRPDTVSRAIYHKKWKRNPVFADVLAAVTKAARQFNDLRTLRALSDAAERLALASPLAAGRLLGLLQSKDENVVYRASVAILDRAGVETAVKAPNQTQILLSWGEAIDDADQFDSDAAETA